MRHGRLVQILRGQESTACETSVTIECHANDERRRYPPSEHTE